MTRPSISMDPHEVALTTLAIENRLLQKQLRSALHRADYAIHVETEHAERTRAAEIADRIKNLADTVHLLKGSK